MTNRTAELKDRVEAKKKKIEAQLAEAKANVRGSKNDTVGKLEEQLATVDSLVQQGWDDLSEVTVDKLNNWLK